MSGEEFKEDAVSAAVSQLADEPQNQQQYLIDRIVIGFGNIVSWIFPLLMIAICSQVVLRKLGHNQAWLDDAQWWMYGFAVITGFAYAITTESHVRVDIFHQHFSVTKKAKIEVFALGWLLLPFLAVMIDIMSQYAWTSWVAREGSDSPNGLHRLYLLKISLPILLALGLLAALSRLRHSLGKFTGVTPVAFILGALPFFWFALERLAYNAFFVYYRITQPELNPRRIPREAIFEHTPLAGLGLLIAALIVAAVISRARRDR